MKEPLRVSREIVLGGVRDWSDILEELENVLRNLDRELSYLDGVPEWGSLSINLEPVFEYYPSFIGPDREVAGRRDLQITMRVNPKEDD